MGAGEVLVLLLEGLVEGESRFDVLLGDEGAELLIFLKKSDENVTGLGVLV